MRIERNARVTGPSQSREQANKDSPPAAGTQDGTGLDTGEPPSSAERFLAYQFFMDPAKAGALAAQLGPSPEDRRQRIVALQNAIADGTYQVSAEQTAEAMLMEQQTRDGTAA